MRTRRSAALVTGIAVAFLTLTLLVPATTSAAHRKGPPPPPAESGDFLFSVNFKYQFGDTGYLVRDGSTGPLYAFQVYGCWYGRNTLSVISQDGFDGSVDLDVIGLPNGVDELLPSSVTVAPRDGETMTIDLAASPDTPLGDHVVTLRGRSGSLTHTAEVGFTVVDELPPCGT